MGNYILHRLPACLMIWSFVSSTSMADEFKLQFSKDFMDAESQQLDGLEKRDSAQSRDNSQPISTPPKPVNPDVFHHADSDFKQPKQNWPDRSLTTPHFPRRQASPEFAQSPDQAGQLFGSSGLLVEQGATQQLISSQEQTDAESFTQLRDDLREVVGDEVYSKMIWAYQDLKALDNSIYAELSQYEVMVQEWLVEVQEIFGLNDQLRAELILPDTPDAEASRLRVAAIESHHETAEDNLASRLKADRLNQDLARAVDFENQSKLFQIVKYLTIKNFLYLLLSVVGVVYFAKFFKFLVRQQ